MKITKLLLASHGTPGARVAEQMAIELCQENQAMLHHLLVVPDFWKGMMGDDWLNNAVSRIRFGNYVENQLTQEAATEIERLEKACQQSGLCYSNTVKLGKPANCLVETAEKINPDLVVIGSPRPKDSPGLRSRMDTDILAHNLSFSLLTVPNRA